MIKIIKIDWGGCVSTYLASQIMFIKFLKPCDYSILRFQSDYQTYTITVETHEKLEKFLNNDKPVFYIRNKSSRLEGE